MSARQPDASHPTLQHRLRIQSMLDRMPRQSYVCKESPSCAVGWGSAPVNFAAAHFFVLWFEVRESRSDFCTQLFPFLCRIGTSPQGGDILSTQQQHFVLSRRFSLDRNFTVVYIAPSDSGGT